MIKRLINSTLSIFTLASITPIYVYAHNLPDHDVQTALVHPFVSPDHALTLVVVIIIAGGIAFLLKKRTSR